MSQIYTNFIIILILIVIMDAIWFKFTLPSYEKVVLNIQNIPMRLNLVSAIISYLILAFGLAYFVIPRLNNGSFIESFWYGGMYGLVVYGVFDMTNMALFKNWNLSISIIDLLWGIFNCTFVTYLTYKIIKLIK
jgi:uncharacterized membrane protein